jgi:membrane protease YdiL (CAAX protease family)
MAFLSAPFTTSSGGPELRALVAGFALMVVGLAALTLRPGRHQPLRSPQATRRALLYAVVYGLCAACFARLLSPALLGRVHSPWLFALGDVMFATLALFIWAMTLAEDLRLSELGFRRTPVLRLMFATALGLAAAELAAFGPLRELAGRGFHAGPDALLFALLAATAGSALPEEMLFRGYLMSSLDGRARRWARVAVPALAFTAVRALRFLPGIDLAPSDWLFYVLGTALPLGLWWGVIRDLAGGSIWPSLISHMVLEFSTTLASATHV